MLSDIKMIITTYTILLLICTLIFTYITKIPMIIYISTSAVTTYFMYYFSIYTIHLNAVIPPITTKRTSIGLALIVAISRTYGSDINILSINKCYQLLYQLLH